MIPAQSAEGKLQQTSCGFALIAAQKEDLLGA
jgi:hypothetical protein